jgi:hypothetical protein
MARPVKHRTQDLDAGDPVCQRVMHLLHESRPTVREPFDDHQFPQRPIPVESSFGQQAGEIEEPAGVVGHSCDRPQVIVEIDGWVVGPTGRPQAKAGLEYPLSQ